VPEPGTDRRVLVVEDNALNRMVAEGMLRLLGYSADSAENGADGLAAARSGTYQLVLMDLHMPGLDGFEVTRRIRAELPSTSQPYIIALTAGGTDGDEQRCREAGMDDYLVKPLTKEALAAALRRSLEWLD
jgi:CheY-like chemotaxis protein